MRDFANCASSPPRRRLAEQQRRWYDFLRWLRSDAEIDGDTTAERLIFFLEGRVDF